MLPPHVGGVTHRGQGGAELDALLARALVDEPGQLLRRARLVLVRQADLVALAQIDRSRQGENERLQRQRAASALLVAGLEPAVPVAGVGGPDEPVAGQIAPHGRRAEAVVLVQGVRDVAGQGLHVPAGEHERVVAQVVQPVVLEVMAQRVGVVRGDVGPDETVVDVLGHEGLQEGEVLAEQVQVGLGADLGRNDRAQVDAVGALGEKGGRALQELLLAALLPGEDRVRVVGVHPGDGPQRPGDPGDDTQAELVGPACEGAEGRQVPVGGHPRGAHEHDIEAERGDVVQNAVGRVEVGCADLGGTDLVDEPIAPPLQWPVVDAVDERRGGGHGIQFLSAGSGPADRSACPPPAASRTNRIIAQVYIS